MRQPGRCSLRILTVGSVALDGVETPFGKVEDAVGGSALFFSTAASYFAGVDLVAVVGDDYPLPEIEFLKERNVDFEGLQIVKGKTFRWKGKYHLDLNDRETLDTQLNVFENFNPVIPQKYRDSKVVFLGNIAPKLQLNVLEQVNGSVITVLDTMNFWIEGSRDDLLKVLEKIHILIINDSECRQLSNAQNIVNGARVIQAMGPEVVIIKKGEHGALMCNRDSFFSIPGLPLEKVFDPTGAGDAFAGGFVGYLAQKGDVSDDVLRNAMVYGSVMASICVEDFSIRALKHLTHDDIQNRYDRFKRLTGFGH